MTPNLLIILTLTTPFVAALLAPWAYRGGKKAIIVPLLGALIPTACLLELLIIISEQNGPLRTAWQWVDTLPLKLTFLVDGFGGLFALMVAGMGVLIVWYGHFYMEDDPKKGRFFGYLLFFLGAMLGIPLSNHLFTTYFFWELTSISSFLLIGFWHHKEKSRAGALKALVITGSGGLFMLGGLALLGAKTGVWEWSDIPAVAANVQHETWFIGAFVLILIGVFTKSAQAPFHFWLPDAMEAPTPVSAFLHSSTMVKAGVFLLFRLFPIFSGLALWFPLLATVGMTTFVMGSVLALKHRDLKAILAYTTIAQLGLFVTLHGYAGIDEILRAGLIFHILAHAFYKGALFMLTGIIDHATHTRDIQKLGGLQKSMPRTAVFFLLASGSLAGLPPFLGFISKESALEASLQMGHLFLPIALGLGAMITVGVAFKISLGVFFAPAQDPIYLKNNHPHEASWGFLFPPALIATLGLIFGLFPGVFEKLIYPVGMVGLAGIETPHFSLWHGINVPLTISLTAIAGGSLIYHFRHPIQTIHEKLKLGWNLNTLYDKKWEWILSTAKNMTDFIQNGSLTRYILVALTFFSALLIYVGWSQNVIPLIPAPNAIPLNLEIFTLGLIGIAAILVVFLEERIARIVALGGAGIMICAFFTLRGAPDLALTGFLVEIIMFVLILIVFNRLDLESCPKPLKKQRVTHITIASIAGLSMGALAYIALKLPLASSINGYFLENSAPLAGGLNAVNVILVDFRGFDTFGEITVLCLAGLGVFALRKVWVGKPELLPMPKQLKMASLPASQLLKPVSGVIVPLIILFSWYMVFRGHNSPGGGFIGGLITAGGLFLELLSEGRNRFFKRLPVNGRSLFITGLAIAFITGLVPLLFGYPFLTSTVFESIHFSTASIFDVGVYLAVVGVTIDILVLIQESERETA